MEWKDVTSYRRGHDRTPTTFGRQCGPIRLVVTSSRIDYPGKWIAHAYPLFEDMVLKAATREEAQAEIVQIVQNWLKSAAAGLVA